MPKRVIISGGGTGGHIFPAVAIADALKRLDPGTEILFVGAIGRMEMERVPAAGYRIVGLDIQGFQRKSLLKNLALPFKIIKSVWKARAIIREFKPDAAVGVGGYASGPLLYAAGGMGVPYLIQEQNSYAGMTNKWLAKKAAAICVAFENMGRFFPADRIIMTGNPVRVASVDVAGKRAEAAAFFGLSVDKPTLLVTGGSLGAGTLNQSMLAALDRLIADDIQLIWQTGKFYYKGIVERVGNQPKNLGIRILEFVARMDLAYAMADVIISRAGAGTIAELCLVDKPVILVPSPNVAEDHQTQNALALVKNKAAVLVRDSDAAATLVETAVALLGDVSQRQELAANIAKMGKSDADMVIAREVLRLAGAEPVTRELQLNDIKQVYLLGIGGIGMSGLARYFHHLGCRVAGYDKTATPLTAQLVEEGIAVSYIDAESEIPAMVKQDAATTLVIYTPAIPADSVLLRYFKSGPAALKKRSEVLGIISRGMFCIAVAGTHGKTTTSGMIAHILKVSGYDCSAFLGGIATNYDSNVLFGQLPSVVVEADEYDRSFLTLHPDIAIVTSMDADHLDIYGDKDSLTDSFRQFVGQLKPGGRLIKHAGLPLNGGVTYAAEGEAEIAASEIEIRDGSFYFTYDDGTTRIEQIRTGIPGVYNIENALAAIRTALALDLDPSAIKEAIESFKGIKRRFEYVVRSAGHVYIDDYAHHPEELRACLTAVKSLYPDRPLTVIFQPHLFSRTRDFAEGFAEVLSMADDLLLLEIYPARELPIAGVTSQLVLDRVTSSKRGVYSKETALDYVNVQQPALLVTVGAGDIDTMVEPLKAILDHA